MKFLFRSKTNRKIAGVCGGLSEYFELDPSLVRILWISAVLFVGTGILIYLVAWLIIPLNPNVVEIKSMAPFQRSSTNRIIAGVCGGLGEYFQIDPVIFRLVFLILLAGCGFGLILYLILWICTPRRR